MNCSIYSGVWYRSLKPFFSALLIWSQITVKWMVSDELDTSGMIKWGNVITSSNRSAQISPIVSGTCTNFGLRYFSKVLKIACTRPGQIALSDALSILPKVTGQSKTDNMWSYSSSTLLTFVSAASISDMVKYYFILCKSAVEVNCEIISNSVNSCGTYSSTYRLAVTSTVVRTAVCTRVHKKYIMKD